MTGRARRSHTIRAIVLVTACAALGGIAIPATAGAKAKERVRLTLPEPGQLAAARLEFKTEGSAKPKLKFAVANKRKLPKGTFVAAQAARYKARRKRERGVALLALGVPAQGQSRAARVTADAALVDVRGTDSGGAISSAEFNNLPSVSRSFLSVLGAEPGSERDLATRVFDLPDNRIFDDDAGRFDLPASAGTMGLVLERDPTLLTRDFIEEVKAEQALASAIAAAVGPPAVLDADIWGYVTGSPVPGLLQFQVQPSGSDPSLVFAAGQWNAPIAGFQISQASPNQLLFDGRARCEDQTFSPGTIRSGRGPRIGPGIPSVRFECELPSPSNFGFMDIPFTAPTAADTTLARLLPYPISDFSGGGLGEAIGRKGVAPPQFAIRY
jgi:hypothetical protein